MDLEDLLGPVAFPIYERLMRDEWIQRMANDPVTKPVATSESSVGRVTRAQFATLDSATRRQFTERLGGPIGVENYFRTQEAIVPFRDLRGDDLERFQVVWRSLYGFTLGHRYTPGGMNANLYYSIEHANALAESLGLTLPELVDLLLIPDYKDQYKLAIIHVAFGDILEDDPNVLRNPYYKEVLRNYMAIVKRRYYDEEARPL